MFESIINDGQLTITAALLCTAVSLLLGAMIAAIYSSGGQKSKSMILTLLLLPALVQAVILMVNGNLGAGVAVAGAFSLVRFRSLPGSGRDILCIFFAMAIGLATGMGYLAFAAVFGIIIALVFVVAERLPFADTAENSRTLQITIPEDLDYTDCFDDIFAGYTTSHKLMSSKTTNMGTMFHLTYQITLTDPRKEKAMMDEIRCRNGNLTVQCGHPVVEDTL